MSIPKGTNISAPIVPNDSRDTYGTHYAKYGIGGFWSVENYADLDFISESRRVTGMRVNVWGDSNPDNNTDWDWNGSVWIKSTVVVAAEDARDSAQNAQADAETARDIAQTTAKVYPTISSALAGTASGDYFSVISSDNNAIFDLYKNVDDNPLNVELISSYPSTALVDKLVHPTARTYYVTVDGSDLNDGTNLKFPLATINKAFELIEELHDIQRVPFVAGLGQDPKRVETDSYIVIVHPGEYIVQPDTVIPRNCALYGYDLRVTKLKLPDVEYIADKPRNMFKMTSGIKVRGFTFSGLMQNKPEEGDTPPILYVTDITDTAIEKAIADTPNLSDGEYFYADDVKHILNIDVDGNRVANLADFDMPPTKGWAFVFNEGEFITRSPYIADCSQLHDFTYTEMKTPIDREFGNPLMPRGGGNIWAQGSILDPDSPLKSVVVDSFTAINPNGFSYLISHGAFVQLVSVFTNWARVGIWSDCGGQVTMANSNTTFGDVALQSTGYRYAIEIPEIDPTEESWPGDTTLFDPDNNNDVIIVSAGVIDIGGAVATPGDTTLVSGDILTTAATSLIDDMWDALILDPSYTAAIDGYTAPQIANFETLTRRDAATLLRSLQSDIIAGSYTKTNIFIERLFDDVTGNSYLSLQVVDAAIYCWEFLKNQLSTVIYISDANIQNLVIILINKIIEVVTTPEDFKTTVKAIETAGLTTTATSLIDDMWEDLILDPSYTAAIDGYTLDQREAFEALTRRDSVTLLRAIQNDINSGQDRGIQFFIKGLFDWKGVSYLRDHVVGAVQHTWEFFRQRLTTDIYSDTDIQTLITTLITTAIDVVIVNTADYRVTYPSTIEATGQQLSYSGTGVNYNSLPFNQRGTGLPPDPRETIIKKNGGKIYATYATQAGDTYLGDDLRVDFERNTIEGQAFSRGVQNITLPLIIGIGA